MEELSDNELTRVAGGISGRQVLATCAGIMMLTGTIPNIMGLNNIADAKITEKLKKPMITVSKVINEKVKTATSRQHQQILQFAEMAGEFFMISYYGSMTRMAYDENGTRQQGTDFNPEANPLYNQLTAVMYAEQIKHMMDIAYLNTDFDTTEYKAKIDKTVAETDFNNFNEKDFSDKIDDIVKAHPEFVEKYWDNEAKFTESIQSALTQSEKIDLLKSLKKKLDVFEAKYRSLWLNDDQARIMYFSVYSLLASDPLGMDAEKEGLAIFKAMGISDQEIKQLQKSLENTK